MRRTLGSAFPGAGRAVLRIAVCAAAAVLVLSCAGGPEPAAETAAAAPPVELRERVDGLRAMIVEYQLAQYAEPTFEEAEAAYRRGIDAYGTDNERAAEALAAAEEGFETVRETGFRELVVRRRNLVEDQIEAGIDARADVAVRDEWTDATESLNEADEAADDGEYLEALVLYDEALADFADATAAAEEKRRRALEAISDAERRREELDTKVEELEEATRAELEAEQEAE